jgi:hypothetical protein
MVFKIMYIYDRDWRIFIPPRQEVRIPHIEQHAPYKWKMEQSWIVDVDALHSAQAMSIIFPSFVEYFDRECINFREMPSNKSEKVARIQRFSTLLLEGHPTKLNGMTCHARSENLAFIDSPEDGDVSKKTTASYLISIAEDYINTESLESPGDLWIRI